MYLCDDNYKVIAHNVSRAKATFGHTIAILLSRIFSVLNSERIVRAGCSSIRVAVVIVRQSGVWNEYANNNMQTSTNRMRGENGRKRCRIQLTFETRSGQQWNNPYLSMNECNLFEHEIYSRQSILLHTVVVIKKCKIACLLSHICI